MENNKPIKRLNKSDENLNISDVSESKVNGSNLDKTIEIITNKRKDSIGLEMEMDLTIGKQYRVVGTHLSKGCIDVIDDNGILCEIRPYMYKWCYSH